MPKLKTPKTKGVAKVPVVLQLDMLECGAACLDMILAYYGKWVPLEHIRNECGINRNGSNAKNMVMAAQSYGLDCKAFTMEPVELKQEKSFPCIIHWGFNHFVVLNGFRGNSVVLNDPAKGRMVVSWEEFDKEFTGIVLFFTPNESFQPSGEKRTALSYLKHLLNPYKKESIIITVASLIVSIFALTFLVLNRVFIEKALVPDTFMWYYGFIVVFLILVIANTLMSCFMSHYQHRAKNKIDSVLSTSYFWKVLHLPIQFFEQRLSDEIARRIQSNNNIARIIVDIINPIIAGMVMMVLYLYIMFYQTLLLPLVGIVALLLTVLIDFRSNKIRNELIRIRMRDMSNLQSSTMSGAQMVEQIKAAGAEVSFMKKWLTYHNTVIEDESIELKKFRILSILPESIKIVVNLIILFLGVGLIVYKQGSSMSLGLIFLMQGTMAFFFEPVSQILQFGKSFQTLANQVDSINDVMNYPLDNAYITEKEKKSTTILSGDIFIDKVSFSYSKMEAPVIQDFSAHINASTCVAICGASGSGKSTITKLLANLYAPNSGNIYFDGKTHAEIDRDVFKDSFAVVEQDCLLFDGTIAQNIVMRDTTISHDEMVQAAKDACIHDEIMELSGGYQYIVEGGGRNLSGGQKQRIEIARALVRKPRICVLDEATSALDALTEHRIIQALSKRNITCVIIAHRLSTIRQCGHIIVLDKGRIVEEGSHDELVNRGGFYYTLITND